ncbi:RNA polymerase sigma factor [Acetobacter sp. TBRC 12305]|uniref:RNA polymerase sigma factor n=1 Tax=Acetobacter garciniae TaxID=2817435 RepID=A0A939HKK8_9PROT|nr:RNA polymerase sigma factor [Acetobacter garciniae]MBO1324465.1 RNA polymerase sigma factor [Acetobacter garciniae]MBX0344154.1 RNA polymerase sigma factor [Acetobacter garciniae]
MKAKRTSLQLYEAHRERLLSYANRLSGDRTLAEDIVQDTWLLFARQPVEQIGAPFQYLRTIVRNLFITRLRRTRNEGTDGVDFDAATQDMADNAASPEAAASARETLARVVAAVDAMPPRQRDAFKLYYFEGLKLREIAMRLDLSIPMVHRLIADGMTICDRIYEEGL